MTVFKRQFGTVRVRKGSALVMVIVLTVLLSLIGTLFIMMSRIDEMSTSSLQTDAELKAAVDAVVDRINKLLVDDVFANGSSWIDGSGDNEAWDYPGDDDAWLANLEPELVDVEYDSGTDIDQIGFRHITDLYAQFQGGTFDGDTPADLVSAWGLRAAIIAPADAIAEGDKADADGDGVADSRWIKIPGIFGEDGKPIYAAVRIIDNGGMINANTAYRNPTGLSTVLAGRAADWDGSQLSHVNLEGITDPVPDPDQRLDATLVQEVRYGTVTTTAGAGDFLDYINDMEYEDRTA